MMKLPRRQVLRLAGWAMACPAISRTAWARTYPDRPVRIVVPFPGGSTSDTVARLIGQWLAQRFGQTFVVENRPGGATNIATEAVVRAAPDGYTLLLIGSVHAINATLYKNLSFSFGRDIAPVASIMRVPGVMVVNPAVPAKTVPEFIAYAKSNPGKINMASGGNGTVTHVAGELFKIMAGVDMIHVPYRGAPPALTDLIGGQVQVMFDNVPTSLELIKTGKLRALAVTAAGRLDVLPEVPPLSDFVHGYEASLWQGIGAPAKTPTEIIDRLDREISAAVSDPDINKRLNDLGGAPFFGSSAAFSRFVADEIEKWAKAIRAANIKPS